MDQSQEIAELKAQNEALKEGIREMRKVFINLLVVVKEAGFVAKQVSDSLLGMDDAIADVKKRFDFRKAASGG